MQNYEGIVYLKLTIFIMSPACNAISKEVYSDNFKFGLGTS